MFTEKTIDRKTIFEGRVFKVMLDTVELTDGSLSRRELVFHNGGACIVAIDYNSQVYLVRQFRKPFEQILLEVPAGKLEPDEAPQVCAARELTEETGWVANTIVPLGRMYPTPGYCSEVLHLYLGLDLDQGIAKPDEGEYVDCVPMPLQTVLDMIDRNEIQDGKTQLAILKAKQYLDRTDWFHRHSGLEVTGAAARSDEGAEGFEASFEEAVAGSGGETVAGSGGEAVAGSGGEG